MHGNNSLSEESGAGIFSLPDTLQGMAATHCLESQDTPHQQVRKSKPNQSLTTWRAESKTNILRRVEKQHAKVVTYSLCSHGQALSTGLKCSDIIQLLTNWGAKNWCYQWTLKHSATLTVWGTKTGNVSWQNTAWHVSYLPTKGMGDSIVSKLETQQGKTTTHIL